MSAISLNLSLLLGGIKISLNMSAVRLIKTERWESLAHFSLTELEVRVELQPELLFSWSCGFVGPGDLVHAEGVQDTESGLVTFFSLEVGKFTLADKNEQGECWGLSESNELVHGIGIGLLDLTFLNTVLNSSSESPLSVVLPDSLEVWFG